MLAFLATFGTVGTFLLAMHDVDDWVLIAWACFCDVVPKVLFAWAGWRLYLKRRHRELRVPSAPRYERGASQRSDLSARRDGIVRPMRARADA